ncbi:MAG: RNA polymerase sigma factor FliA [Campylobacterales bacterium]
MGTKNKALQGYEESVKAQEESLAQTYLPYVKSLSFRLKERLPSSVEVNDLFSVGAEELVKLARRYDSKLNDSFWGYAKSRVYGAMLDYLRSLDPLSRGSRRLVKVIDKVSSEYYNEHQEDPSDEYLAEAIGESIEKIREAKIASEIYSVMPIEEQLNSINETDIQKSIEEEELVEKIKQIIETFKERDRMVIQLYYFEELSLKEISKILDITESRISQINKALIQKIRITLGEDNG